MASSFDRLARNMKNGGTPAYIPRAPQLSLHQGTVSGVDLFNGIVNFQFNDPSGLVLPGVRFLQSYSTDNPPAAGHVVWAAHFGTDLLVLGQHVVPANIVIP